MLCYNDILNFILQFQIFPKHYILSLHILSATKLILEILAAFIFFKVKNVQDCRQSVKRKHCFVSCLKLQEKP